MESVMISIKPRWCELIASGKKTIEVRKTRPKCDVPFKCYIYCTMDKHDRFICRGDDDMPFYEGNGAVIGEFVCNYVEKLDEADLFIGLDEISDSRIEEYSCVDIDSLLKYKGAKQFIYGWHISDLVIYAKPKDLSKFYISCGDNPKCDGCEAFYYSNTECGKEEFCCSIIEGYKPMKRPPQSWCYVEEE